MELVSEALPGGIMGSYLEEGYPLYTINDTMLNILGYTYEELVDATNEKMMNIIYPPDQKWVEESIEKQFHEKNEYKVEYRIVGKGGRIIWVSDIGKKIKSEDGRDAMISIMTDVSDRIERENQLIKEAQLDPLTGLYNRKRAISLIEADFLKEKSGTLYICDVDNFKSMNDTKGHLAGDRALIHLAKLIQHYADENCVTARLGGDEFMLYFTEDAEKKGADVIGKIQKEFAIAMKTSNPDLDITISAGGALRNAGEDFKDLYKKADTALYLAKKEKGQLKIYKEQ
jgi:diguanylate cyclase (GGDEF)-like protein/PAS domain S-box-containing protein